MNMLEQLAKDIIKCHKDRLVTFEGMPKTRMGILKEMHDELMQLKKTFSELYPDEPQEVEETFSKLLK